MAERRMLAKSIIDTDQFMNMSLSARMLYVDLAIRADDDGFISPKKVMRMTEATEEDLKELVMNDYLFQFSTGIVVIIDWVIHNTIRKDMYHKSLYTKERALIKIPPPPSARKKTDNLRYELLPKEGESDVYVVSYS